MEFFVIINDEQKGPFSIDQLATLDITPDTEVWAQGMDDWMQAGDVPALTTLLQQLEYKRLAAAQANPVNSVPPAYTPAPAPERPRPYVPDERTYVPPAEPEKKKSGSHGCLWSSLVVIIMLAVLVITVPSREDHLNTIKDVTREWMGATVDDTRIGGTVLGEVAKWVGGSGADLVIEQMFSYDNYFVCSVGTFNYGNESKKVSLGVLGHVFTFNKGDINQAIKSAVGIKEPETPTEEVTPPVEEVQPEPAPEPEQPQVEENTEEEKSNPAQELLDSIAARAKREAVKAAKEWAKKKIDEM